MLSVLGPIFMRESRHRTSMYCFHADACHCSHSWNQRVHSEKTPESEVKDAELQTKGFGSISRRQYSCKPIIAAVNGGAYGGGTEMILNCDLVVAAEDAVIATPEVKRGVVAVMGGMFPLSLI